MGNCYSHDDPYAGKVNREVDDKDYNLREENDFTNGDGEARIRLRGSSRFVSMYTQQGSKGINQDALTVWENFTGDKDMVFCGVFDGHGPLGHKVSQYIRDNLPSKLSASIKMSQQKACKYYDTYFPDRDNNVYVHCDNNKIMSLASWEGSLTKSFNEMDEDVARDINTDSFVSGATAVTVIKQGDHLIVSNLGDSRAVLCTRGDKEELIPVQLTVDLKPDIPSEAIRIHNCEGRVVPASEESDVCRIYMPDENCPGLAMSRAFGDFCLKDYGLISVPDIFYRKLTKQDQFVVLATDGVWDVLTNIEVVSIVASAPSRSMAAKLLVKHAVGAWRFKYPFAKVDDCAVICLFLDGQPGKKRCQKKHLRRRRSKSTRHEDNESLDGKSTIEFEEDWEVLGGISRANSGKTSKTH